MDTLKRIEKIIGESAFDKKKKKPGLKFNPGLALTGARTTGPWRIGAGEERVVGGRYKNGGKQENQENYSEMLNIS